MNSVKSKVIIFMNCSLTGRPTLGKLGCTFHTHILFLTFELFNNLTPRYQQPRSPRIGGNGDLRQHLYSPL